MPRKSLYRPATPEEQRVMLSPFGGVFGFVNEPRVRPAKPPKGAKRKTKR